MEQTPLCRCGEPMEHEYLRRTGAIRHVCPRCHEQQYGRVTDATCTACSEFSEAKAP